MFDDSLDNAILNEHVDIVKLLLASGANVNYENSSICQTDCEEIVKILMATYTDFDF